jgi:hypothetical protein
MDFAFQPIFAPAGFALILAFGVWLYRAGRPYPGALFNVHKLLALVVVVLGGIPMWRGAGASAAAMAVLVVSGLSVAALFVSGALMSAGKLDPRAMRFTHSLAAILLTGACGLALTLRLMGG